MVQQALQGPPAGVLLCYAAYQALKWPSSLGSFSVLSCQCQGIPGEGKAAVMASLTQQYRLASMAAGLSSTVISLVSPKAVSLQSGADSSQPQCAPGDLHPCPGCVRLWPGLSVWFSLHSDHHRSAASLSNSLTCLHSVPNYCSSVGISPLPQFLRLPGCWSRPTHSPPLFPFLPSSYQVLLGSVYSFPVFGDSCPLSAVAL